MSSHTIIKGQCNTAPKGSVRWARPQDCDILNDCEKSVGQEGKLYHEEVPRMLALSFGGAPLMTV